MRNSSFGALLPPLEPLIPAPKAIELDPLHGWSAWDSAVAELDDPQDKQALSLWLEKEKE